MERQRCAELERVIANERKQLHERDLGQSGFIRENEDLKSEIDRLNLRIQSNGAFFD
jgi:hypothetical protein